MDNLLIKGDSKEELPKLQKEYEKKVKAIIIDPPYNTERKDMTYNDNFEEEGFRDLLKSTFEGSYPLLKDEGICFVSISGHNMHIVRDEMDKVYGKKNYAATMIRIENAKKQKIGGAALKENYEYVIAYYKNKDKKELNYILNKDFEKYQNEIGRISKLLKEDEYLEDILFLKNSVPSMKELKVLKNIWLLQESNKGLKQYRYSYNNIVFRAADINMYLGKGATYDMIHPITGEKCKKPKYGYPAKNKIKGFKENEYGDLEFEDEYIQISSNKILCGNIIFGLDEKKIPDYKNELDIMSHPDTLLKDMTGSEDRYVTSLFNGVKVFDYPKPLKLIDYLIDISTKEGDLVIDYFGGSGTTGESAFKKNRKFILIQRPDNIKDELKEKLEKNEMEHITNIYDITSERLKRAGVDFIKK